MGGDWTRRRFLATAGSGAAFSMLSGCTVSTPDQGRSCQYDPTPEAVYAAVTERLPQGYDTEEEQAWRAAATYHEDLKGLLAAHQDGCDPQHDGSTFIGEKHILGDGMKGVLGELEAAADHGDGYDTLCLEFFSPDDPIVDGFNHRTVPDGVEQWRSVAGYDDEPDEVTPEEMAAHYLLPMVRKLSGATKPLRWERDEETLVDIFTHCRENDITVAGIEPPMYHPLYPEQAWGDRTRTVAQEELREGRFETMVDNVQAEVDAGNRTLALSGYAHTQEAMHTYTALLTGMLGRVRRTLSPEDLVEHPYSYQPLFSNSMDLPFYVLDEERYTLHGRMPDATTLLATSAAEQLGMYEGHLAFLDTDTATAILDEQISTLQTLQELKEEQPVKAASHFGFLVRLHPHTDFDNDDRTPDRWDDDQRQQWNTPAWNLVTETLNGTADIVFP